MSFVMSLAHRPTLKWRVQTTWYQKEGRPTYPSLVSSPSNSLALSVAAFMAVIRLESSEAWASKSRDNSWEFKYNGLRSTAKKGWFLVTLIDHLEQLGHLVFLKGFETHQRLEGHQETLKTNYEEGKSLKDRAKVVPLFILFKHCSNTSGIRYDKIIHQVASVQMAAHYGPAPAALMTATRRQHGIQENRWRPRLPQGQTVPN